MADVITAAYKTSANSSTQIEKRDVGDQIRSLFPADSQFLALVAKGEFKGGAFKKSKGMITKRTVHHRRFENYTYTPIAYTCIAASISGTTLTVDATEGFRPYFTLINSTTGTTCRIDSVTNSTVLEITSFGSTSFDITAGDVLICGAPAYPQYSSSPSILSKNEDNVYNICQQVRFSVAISDVAQKTPTHAVNDYWAWMKETNIREGLRRTEASMIMGNRPSSGDTSTGGSALDGAFESMRGVYQWAQNTFNAQNNMTPALFRKELPQNFTNKTVNPSDRMVMFCGSEINGRMQEWVNDRNIMAKDGQLEKFGLKSKRFVTSDFEVEVVKHNLFDQGALANQALLFAPDQLQYVCFNGKDLKPNKGIQSNSTLGTQDEIEGFLSVGTRDAGNSIMKITNWYNL